MSSGTTRSGAIAFGRWGSFALGRITMDALDKSDSERLLTEAEVAERLRVKPCTVANERRRMKIECTMVGSQIRYSEKQFEEYLERQRVRACVDASRNQDNMESISSANGADRQDLMAHGLELGTTSQHVRLAERVLARQTFRKQAAGSQSG
jgi:hypothetical protein